jgi:hypothetical protein
MKNLRILALILLLTGAAFGQGARFNFQGRLNDGAAPANGAYDLQFKLYNSITGGGQIGSAFFCPNTTVINGVFSVTLDFGPTAFNNNPGSIFLEIGVRPSGSPNAFTILGPRQQLTVVPFSVRAATAANADNANTVGGFDAGDFIWNSSVARPDTNFNISGNGVVGGNLNVGGNVTTTRDKNGFVKAMLYVNQFGAVVRCYNGVTGSSTGNCGFTVTPTGLEGVYTINFGFQVDDRFISVTPGSSYSVTIVASFRFLNNSPNLLQVTTNITDIDHTGSTTNDDFMVIVY